MVAGPGIAIVVRSATVFPKSSDYRQCESYVIGVDDDAEAAETAPASGAFSSLSTMVNGLRLTWR
jgi:hypothetical protein